MIDKQKLKLQALFLIVLLLIHPTQPLDWVAWSSLAEATVGTISTFIIGGLLNYNEKHLDYLERYIGRGTKRWARRLDIVQGWELIEKYARGVEVVTGGTVGLFNIIQGGIKQDWWQFAAGFVDLASVGLSFTPYGWTFKLGVSVAHLSYDIYIMIKAQQEERERGENKGRKLQDQDRTLYEEIMALTNEMIGNLPKIEMNTKYGALSYHHTILPRSGYMIYAFPRSS